jgi:hypothetical protein
VTGDAHAAAELAVREHYSRVLAWLAAQYGDVAAATKLRSRTGARLRSKAIRPHADFSNGKDRAPAIEWVFNRLTTDGPL